jgi:Ca-activated chloride channel family protein
MFSFAYPLMALLLLLPLAVRFFMTADKKESGIDAPEVSFPGMARLEAAFAREELSTQSHRFYYAVLTLLWLCLTGALMQPQLVDKFTEVRNKGYDIMLAVDLSGSMKALDYVVNDHRTSRIDVVKSVVSQFVSQRQGDRIGLVLFGTNAYLHVPLTQDTLSVRKMLNNTEVGEAGDATAIGDAIGIAVRNLRDRPQNSRIIVLLTDGGDNSSTVPPLEAAKLAKEYGIRIYTIGVGTTGAVPIPDRNGQIVMAQFDIDEDLLRKIAEMTDGGYFRATDTETLQKVYDQINHLEKTESETKSYVIRQPLYRYPLGAALALLFLLSLMPVYKKVRHGF